jgi:glycosyltransferase involved in cell wall biosynthesis
MINPVLSLCIATYNRSGFIGETLNSIVHQLTNEVEVVIVDGASTDNTKDVVAKYVEKYSQIKYIELPCKGGVDQDYCKAVEFSKGQMCWLFTDDDLLVPNAIARVLSEVKKEFSLIVVNSGLMTMDFTSQICERLMCINEDKIFTKAELGELFSEVVTYISFIGAVVVNRELWLEREKTLYFGTEFVHVGVIFQSPLPRNCLLVSEPLIRIRYGNAQWSTRAFNIGMIKWPRLLWSFENIKEEVKKPFVFSTPSSNWRAMLIFRAKGQYTLGDFEAWAEYKQNSISRRWIGKIIAVIPSIILNFAILFYMKTVDRSKVITLYDMKRYRSLFFSNFPFYK